MILILFLLVLELGIKPARKKGIQKYLYKCGQSKHDGVKETVHTDGQGLGNSLINIS